MTHCMNTVHAPISGLKDPFGSGAVGNDLVNGIRLPSTQLVFMDLALSPASICNREIGQLDADEDEREEVQSASEGWEGNLLKAR
ncbi:hypothetical protein BX616_002090 [Lobosporangium transversale]|nr:hypothetical protein BX616_002090 [Lobosporangium transversale]